jgi:hypothetical protein
VSKWPGFDLHAELIADVERRFWSNVRKTPTCWEWTGRASADGYGRIKIGGKERNATVVSWALHFGPIPPMGLMCHHCDNPPCIRPEHLFLGDHSLNAHDLNLKKKQQASGVIPHNEGDLLERIEAHRSRLTENSRMRELAAEERALARQVRHELRGIRSAEGRRMAAIEGRRLPVPMSFTDDEIREIRGVPEYPGINSDLGRRFNVSRQSIKSIRLRRTYAHVGGSHPSIHHNGRRQA